MVRPEAPAEEDGTLSTQTPPPPPVTERAAQTHAVAGGVQTVSTQTADVSSARVASVASAGTQTARATAALAGTQTC